MGFSQETGYQVCFKDSSLFTLLLSRKFYNQFINLYYRYILQAMITSRDAALVETTILDIYQLVRIPQRNGKYTSILMENEGSSIQLLFAQTRIGYVLCVGHVIFCVIFLFYCVVISDYGLFILVTRDGLYPYMGLKKNGKV